MRAKSFAPQRDPEVETHHPFSPASREGNGCWLEGGKGRGREGEGRGRGGREGREGGGKEREGREGGKGRGREGEGGGREGGGGRESGVKMNSIRVSLYLSIKKHTHFWAVVCMLSLVHSLEVAGGTGGEDGLAVGEGIEGELPVVGPVAAVPNSSKWERGDLREGEEVHLL